jgi:hypothetical protein
MSTLRNWLIIQVQEHMLVEARDGRSTTSREFAEDLVDVVLTMIDNRGAVLIEDPPEDWHETLLVHTGGIVTDAWPVDEAGMAWTALSEPMGRAQLVLVTLPDWAARLRIRYWTLRTEWRQFAGKASS